MRLRLEATPEELASKGESLIKALVERLAPHAPDLTEVLSKALQEKTAPELRYPVLKGMHALAKQEYEHQMRAAVEDIMAVLAGHGTVSNTTKSLENDSAGDAFQTLPPGFPVQGYIPGRGTLGHSSADEPLGHDNAGSGDITQKSGKLNPDFSAGHADPTIPNQAQPNPSETVLGADNALPFSAVTRPLSDDEVLGLAAEMLGEMELSKARITKYKRRWKGPDGKWRYEYADSATKLPTRELEPHPDDVEDRYKGSAIKRGMDLSQAEDAIRDHKVESCVAYGSKGQQLYRNRGGKGSVKITATALMAMREDGNAVFTHNHPNSSTFSDKDLVMAHRANLKEMRACTGNPPGAWVVTRPEGGWPDAGEWHRALRLAVRIAQQEINAEWIAHLKQLGHDVKTSADVRAATQYNGVFRRFGVEIRFVPGRGADASDRGGATPRRDRSRQVRDDVPGRQRSGGAPAQTSGGDGDVSKPNWATFKDALDAGQGEVLIRRQRPQGMTLEVAFRDEKAARQFAEWIEHQGHGKPMIGRVSGKWVVGGTGLVDDGSLVGRDHPDNYDGPIQRGMSLPQVEDTIRKLPHEHGLFVGADGRQILRATDGKEDGISFTKDIMETVLLDGNVTFTHNHPRGSPLSWMDVAIAIQINLKEMRATRPEGGAWTLKRPEKGWGVDPEQIENGEVTRQLRSMWVNAIEDAHARMDKYMGERGGAPGDTSHPAFSTEVFDGFVNEEWLKAVNKIGKDYGWQVTREGATGGEATPDPKPAGRGSDAGPQPAPLQLQPAPAPKPKRQRAADKGVDLTILVEKMNTREVEDHVQKLAADHTTKALDEAFRMVSGILEDSERRGFGSPLSWLRWKRVLTQAMRLKEAARQEQEDTKKKGGTPTPDTVQLSFDDVQPPAVGDRGPYDDEAKKADYHQNGPKARAFKEWFGDWESGQGSKVVKKSGEPQEQHNMTPVTVFHGTAAGGFSEFNAPDKLGYNLISRGIYFTEDRSIAQEYTEKDSDPKHLYSRMHALQDRSTGQHTKTLPKKLATELIRHSAEATNPNWDPAIYWSAKNALLPDGSLDVEKLMHNMRNLPTGQTIMIPKEGRPPHAHKFWGHDSEARPMAWEVLVNRINSIAYDKKMRKKRDGPLYKPEVPAPQVYEVFLNIRKPVDFDAPITKAEFRDWAGYRNARSVSGMDSYDDSVPHDQQTQKRKERFERLQREEHEPAESMSWYSKDLVDDLAPGTGDQEFEMNYEQMLEAKRKLRAATRTKRWTAQGVIDVPEEPMHPALHLADENTLTWGDVHYIMSDGLKFQSEREEATDFFQKRGYDGIKHTGGWNIGSKPHTVWIAFKSEQIKAVANQGTFNPESADIFKSEVT